MVSEECNITRRHKVMPLTGLNECLMYRIQWFQLGIFLRALHPAHTVLRPDRFTQRLARIKNNIFFFHLQNVIAVVFSDSRCKNACRVLPMFSSIAHKIVLRPRFVRMLDCDQFLSFTRKSVSFAQINCARICHSRARLCPISFAPCPFPKPSWNTVECRGLLH